MDKLYISNLIVSQMVDISSFINILVCEINHCTLGYSILNEYGEKTHKSSFHAKHPLDAWGGFAGGCFKNQLKIDF